MAYLCIVVLLTNPTAFWCTLKVHFVQFKWFPKQEYLRTSCAVKNTANQEGRSLLHILWYAMGSTLGKDPSEHLAMA